MIAPIILFVYNRPSHTRQTVEALKLNELANQSDLFIFSDNAKTTDDIQKVAEVREYIHSIIGFKQIKIIERQTNLGLANSVIQGVTEILKNYEQAIILEDDLVSSKSFLLFMNECLLKYKDDKRIFSISGYGLPINVPNTYMDDIYLYYRIGSWGWATWKDRWDKVDWTISDFDLFIKDWKARKAFNRGGEDSTIMLMRQMFGAIDSWAIRFNYACFKNKSFCIYPVQSKILNIGADGSGTHVSKTNKYLTTLDNQTVSLKLSSDLILNHEICSNVQNHFKRSLFRKLINFFIILFPFKSNPLIRL